MWIIELAAVTRATAAAAAGAAARAARAPLWRLASCAGRAPSGRSGHSACAAGAHVAVFGGMNGKSYLHDLALLHTPSLTWSWPRVGAPPAAAPRAAAAAGDDGDEEGGGACHAWPSQRMRAALVGRPRSARAADDVASGELLVFGGARAPQIAGAVPYAPAANYDGDMFALSLAFDDAAALPDDARAGGGRGRHAAARARAKPA